VQHEPGLLSESKKIVDIAAGNNHVMTLDNKGKVETWGAPEMNQLGRRVVQRDMKASALRPGGLSFKRGTKIVKIACGSYHSFAIDDCGRLYAWGLNSYGELGLQDENVGEDANAVLQPTIVESLADYKIEEIAGGEHHSIACAEGKLLVWGRIDGKQTGLTADKFNRDNTVYDDHEKPRILTVPTVHEGLHNVVSVACGIDNSFAITEDGKAYSWGFSANYQTGQGEQDDDVEVPTLIDNSAVRGRKMLFAGAGGQFSVLTSIHQNA
jgi:regulator of chromosome condensation